MKEKAGWMKFDRVEEQIIAVAEVGINYKREEIGTKWYFTDYWNPDDLICKKVKDAMEDPSMGDEVFVEFRLDIEIDENGKITGEAVPTYIGLPKIETITGFPKDTSFKEAMDSTIVHAIIDKQEESE